MSTFESFRTPAELRQKRGFDGVFDLGMDVYERTRQQQDLNRHERHMAIKNRVPRVTEPFNKPVHLQDMLSGTPSTAGTPMYKRSDRRLLAVLARKIRGER